MMETQTTPDVKRKRRWLQFSLSGLFVLVTAISGWFIYHARQHAADEAVLAQVRAVDAKAEAFWGAPAWWSQIVGDRPAGVLERVRSLSLHGHGLDGERLAALPLDQLTQLESVVIEGPLESDEDAKDLQQLCQGAFQVMVIPSYDIEQFDANFVTVYGQDSSPTMTEKLKRALRNHAYQPQMLQAEPDELSYGCIRFGNSNEEAAAKLLTMQDESVRICAASTLWKLHSRVNAKKIVDLVAGLTTTTKDAERLKKRVARDLQKENILAEINSGDHDWGCWLASLRPDRELSMAMMTAVKSGRATLSTIYALGQSKDRHVIPTLVDALGDQKLCGNEVVERALVPFGDEELEKTLLAGIPGGNDYFACNAASVLGEIGTARSLEVLEKMATDPKYDNAPINVQNVSHLAFQSIRSREADKAEKERERKAEAENVANQ